MDSDLNAGLSTELNGDCFALLDDHSPASTPDAPLSRLYTQYQVSLIGHSMQDLPGALAQMQEAIANGWHALGLFHYELGAGVVGLAPDEAHQASGVLFEILLFANCQRMTPAQVHAWLQQHTAAHQVSGVANLRSNVTQAEFAHALDTIHRYLEAGDSYQVNYTWRLKFDMFGDLCDFYSRLRQRQAVPYGALIRLPDGRAVLSFSPELFVRHAAGQLTTQPMKGTAAACNDEQIDAAAAKSLARDPKNRAENVMIVDLLRNDLGRIAQTGSVQVPALFEVKRYNSVLQMTSTVTAKLRADVSLSGIFTALFPCGSITGAPKRRTMEIIRQLEAAPRGLYTGAIGWFDRAQVGHQVNDFCLSVPIRTLSLAAPGCDGVRHGEMGVGAGIVFDSQTGEEYEECLLKASFLTGLPARFELFETMYVSQQQGCRNLEAHLQRLTSSAHYFGFDLEPEQVQLLLARTCAGLQPGLAYRLKLILDQSGTARCEIGQLGELAQPVRLLLAERKMAANQVFLRHKTTLREEYDAGWRRAESQGAFDTLFYDADGYIAEGGRSNVLLQIDGAWYTPALAQGVLPGVMRARLMRELGAQERALTLADLQSAQQVIVCNALRGALLAKLDLSQESNPT